ncbi:MAG: hypothetical protein M1816_007554 [Peltula sp. TS41687]|nr:MAG: hypothetical protein M1816_007554 [Peltula sp. TS41687]
MDDYSKLRVVDLKAELKKRGLPQSGLKQAMVDRLRDADAQAAESATSGPGPSDETREEVVQPQQVVEPEASIENPPDRNDEEAQTHEAAHQDTQMDIPPRAEDENAPETDAHLAPTEPESVDPTKDIAQDIAPIIPPTLAETIEPAAVPVSELEAPIAPNGGDIVLAADSSTEIHPDPQEVEMSMPSEVVDTVAQAAVDAMDISKVLDTSAMQTMETQESLPPPVPEAQESEIEPKSRLTSQDSEEALADARKRKRRSQSPVPSTQSIVQKRAKLDDVSPHVHLEKDDGPMRDDDQTQQTQTRQVDEGMRDASMNTFTQEQEGERMDVDGKEEVDPTQETLIPDPAPQRADSPSETASPKDVAREPGSEANGEELTLAQPHESRPSSPRHSPSSPNKPATISPKASRYRDAFTGSGPTENIPRRSPSPLQHDEHRDIAPALHPATSALYIRELMRPLHPPSLKNHLTALATPQSSSPDPNILTEFFLDQIRTHCFVAFANVSAASRVRSALHNSIWPEERSRKPLWADFIPEEKVQEWIKTEQDSASSGGSGRASSGKRWEVIYEKIAEFGGDGTGVQAVLREVGPNGSMSANLGQGRGVQGAPSGPRRRGEQPERERAGVGQPQQQQQQSSHLSASRSSDSGFMALDSLFRSTTAKPKLYYLPVSKELAESRLDKIHHLRARRSGYHGRGNPDELRRYTFEDGDRLVDLGTHRLPGAGGGRGYGGPGGYRGGGYGYGGRGGFGRDRGWRGDHRRDRW